MTISNRRAYVLSFGLTGLFGLVACGEEAAPTGGKGGGGGTAPTGGSVTGGTAGVGVTGGTAGVGVTGGTAGVGVTGGTAGVGVTGGTAGAGGAGAGGGGAGGAAGDSGAAGAGAGGAAGMAGGGAGGAGGGAGGASGNAGAGGTGGGGTVCAGNAVSFGKNGTGKASDAARQRVMVDLASDLPINNANRTVEFWAFVRSTDWVGETNTIYEYGTQNASAAGFGLDFGGTQSPTNGTIDPYTNGGYDNDNQATMLPTNVDQWVHFAMTWNGTAVITYVNGTARSTRTGTGGLHTEATPITIGCNNPRFSCFGGYIDEFRVWNVARSATEIMMNYNKGLTGMEAGLVNYLKFNEASGTTTADAVTGGGHTAHNGTLTMMTGNPAPTFVAPAMPLPITCP